MCNPPLLDERTGRRASSLSEAAGLFADLVASGTRTICFARSRRAAELIYQFARMRLDRRTRRPASAEPDRPLPRPATRRSSAARSSGALRRATCSASSPPARSSSGIDIGHLDAAISVTFPGTVASLRQQWGRAGRRERGRPRALRRGRRRARPVLLPPPGRVPRPSGRVGDPRPHLGDASTCATWCGGLRGAARGRRRETRSAPDFEQYAKRLVSAGELRERDGRYLPRRAGFPAAAGVAALGVARQLHRRRRRGRRAARASSRRSAPSRPSTRARSTCTWESPTRSRSSTSRTGARSCGPPTATTTRSRRSRPRPSSRRCARSATCSGWSCGSGSSRSPRRSSRSSASGFPTTR